jgi:integrase
MASVRERQTSSGERTWQVLYRHGGKQASRTFTAPKPAEKFRALVDALGADGAVKALAEGTETGLTVTELAEQYLAWKARDVTERTMTDYRRDVANWVVPWLGHRSADAVDEGDVQRWVDHMAERLAPKSVADRHMLLHSMYEFGRAKSRRLVDHNPCKETELPKKGKRGLVQRMTVADYRALLEVAANRNPDAHDLILHLGSTGWRFSEATAMPVRVVEDIGDLWVTVDRVFRLDASGRQFLAENEAKSQAAFRRIRPTADAWPMLRRRVVGKAPGDCVMIAAGASLAEIQRRVGHESIQTTINVYGSGIGDVSSDALRNAEAILTGRRAVNGDVVLGEVVTPRELEAP